MDRHLFNMVWMVVALANALVRTRLTHALNLTFLTVGLTWLVFDVVSCFIRRWEEKRWQRISLHAQQFMFDGNVSPTLDRVTCKACGKQWIVEKPHSSPAFDMQLFVESMDAIYQHRHATPSDKP